MKNSKKNPQQKPLTRRRFEGLLVKAAQPVKKPSGKTPGPKSK